MNTIPIIGQQVYTVGVKLTDKTWQFWTGDFVLLPGFPDPTSMKPFPIWTMYPERAKVFEKQEAAVADVEMHDRGFRWAASVHIVPGKRHTKQ